MSFYKYVLLAVIGNDIDPENAYILSNSSGTGADAIKAENSFNVKKMLLSYKDDYNNASKSLYPKLGTYVKELRSYKNALEAK